MAENTNEVAPKATVKLDPRVEALGLKKTMNVLALLLLNGGANKLPNWELIVNEMKPKDGSTGDSKPREVTILKDIEGGQLGRKCSVTGKWFINDKFFKSGTLIKEADGAKNKLYAESKTMETNAKSLLVEARELNNPLDKVKKFEAYDEALEKAKAHRATAIKVDPKWLEGSFATIEDLAKHLKVEINPIKPADDTAKEGSDSKES